MVVKPGHTLAMSEIRKALAVADRQMGDQMGTKYAVDESLSLSFVHVFRTRAEPDELKLKESLGKLPGFKTAWKYKEGFGVAFEGAPQPTLRDIQNASGIEVVDVLLAPSKDGKRYFCPMHPDLASPVPSECSVCRMKLAEVAAGSIPGTLARASLPRLYVCSMDGGMRESPGPCPKCGMKLGERDLVAAGSQKPAGKYVCSMDGGLRDTPGKCPKCGMTLTDRDYVTPGAKGPSSAGRGKGGS